jgi:hypothetical protein
MIIRRFSKEVDCVVASWTHGSAWRQAGGKSATLGAESEETKRNHRSRKGMPAGVIPALTTSADSVPIQVFFAKFGPLTKFMSRLTFR